MAFLSKIGALGFVLSVERTSIFLGARCELCEVINGIAKKHKIAIAPQLIANSDLIAILPSRIVEMSGLAAQLHLAALPIEIAPSTLKMMWHERNHRHPAQEWLRTRLIEICKNL